MGEIIENGHRKKLYVFVFCLGWSRQRYVEFITSLNSAVFNGCMHRALKYIGGELSEFPYVNGGLFEKEIVIPRI